MKKPMIAVTALFDAKKNSYWMLPGYMEGVEEAGGIPVMLPLTACQNSIRQLSRSFDGFLFTGGQDVSPAVYSEIPSPNCGESCDTRDKMETTLLQCVLELDKPILGICRGIQLLNAFLGGTLYQDLPTDHPSGIQHHMSPPYNRPVHKVSLVFRSPLHRLLKANELFVNSYHHQAVKMLAPSLTAMAYSDDGLVEGVYMPGKKFVWAVQWHPEFSYRTDENSRRIFSAFVAACSL